MYKAILAIGGARIRSNHELRIRPTLLKRRGNHKKFDGVPVLGVKGLMIAKRGIYCSFRVTEFFREKREQRPLKLALKKYTSNECFDLI